MGAPGRYGRRLGGRAGVVALFAALVLGACKTEPPLAAGAVEPRGSASPLPPAPSGAPRDAPDATVPAAPASAATPPTPASAATAEPATQPLVIYIQPLGAELPDDDVALVQRALLAFYRADVRMLERVPLPTATKNVAKTRYRAEKLLDVLAERLPPDGHRILGLTGADISTTKGAIADWGILGLATLDGTCCIISKFRTGRGTKTPLEARERLGKVAVHEIGHTLGLPHCPTVGCLMEDAQGTVLTCDREYDLCPECRRKLTEAGHGLANGAIPWPKP